MVRTSFGSSKSLPIQPITPGWYSIVDHQATNAFRGQSMVEVIEVRKPEGDVLFNAGGYNYRMDLRKFSAAVVRDPEKSLSAMLAAATGDKAMPGEYFARGLMAHENPEIAALAERVAARQMAEADDFVSYV